MPGLQHLASQSLSEAPVFGPMLATDCWATQCGLGLFSLKEDIRHEQHVSLTVSRPGYHTMGHPPSVSEHFHVLLDKRPPQHTPRGLPVRSTPLSYGL